MSLNPGHGAAVEGQTNAARPVKASVTNLNGTASSPPPCIQHESEVFAEVMLQLVASIRTPRIWGPYSKSVNNTYTIVYQTFWQINLVFCPTSQSGRRRVKWSLWCVSNGNTASKSSAFWGYFNSIFNDGNAFFSSLDCPKFNDKNWIMDQIFL